MDEFVYLYIGEKVVIVDSDALKTNDCENIEIDYDGSGHSIVSLEDYVTFLKGAGVETLESYDDSYFGYTGPYEIDDYHIPNIENEQRLVYCFATEENGNAMEIEKEFGVITDRYYDWTSIAKDTLDRLYHLYNRYQEYGEEEFEERKKKLENEYNQKFETYKIDYPTNSDYNWYSFEDLDDMIYID